MGRLSDRPTLAFRLAEAGVLALPIAWLAAAAVWVSVDYFDGFDSIANGLYYVGETDRYIVTRAPLMGGLLAPALAVQRALALHPLDLRPVHATVGLLNGAYLLGVYLEGGVFGAWLGGSLYVAVLGMIFVHRFHRGRWEQITI